MEAMEKAAHTEAKPVKVRGKPRQGLHGNPEPKKILAHESQHNRAPVSQHRWLKQPPDEILWLELKDNRAFERGIGVFRIFVGYCGNTRSGRNGANLACFWDFREWLAPTDARDGFED